MTTSGAADASIREDEDRSRDVSFPSQSSACTSAAPVRSCNWCGNKKLKLNRLKQLVCRNPRCGRVQP